MVNTLKKIKQENLNQEIPNQIELNQKITKLKQNNKKNNKQNDNFDYYYQITKTLREKTLKPPKNSLAELVVNEKIKELTLILKNNNVDLEIRDECGTTASWTPLYWGVKYRKIDCVKLLLSYGANINTVINDLEECCGTVLDLATLRCDGEMELLLRSFAEKEEVKLSHNFQAIRTKLRGKSPAFNFNYYNKKATTLTNKDSTFV